MSAEHKVFLDELNGEIRRNFDHRGWLPLLDVDHPPSATLIREFYSNLSIHSYDSNTLVRSWIWGEEYTITPSVVAVALGVPLVQHPIYPYDSLCSLMTLCNLLLVLLSSEVLILGSPLTSWPRFIIFSFGFLAIWFGLSLICTPFLWRDVHFCMRLSLILLWAFLIFSFILWLRYIRVVLLLMLFSSLSLFIEFCYI